MQLLNTPLFFLSLCLTSLVLIITCSNFDPNGPDDRRLVISVMKDTSVSINDSFYVHVSTNHPGSTGLKFIWNIPRSGLKDTTQDSLLKVSFKDTGSFNIIVSVINQKNQLSDSYTFQVSVYAVQKPFVKAMHDTTIFVNDTIFLHATGINYGTIIKYLWSVDGMTFDTTTDSILKKVWPIDSPGLKTLYVRVINYAGFISETDSAYINVLLGAPRIHAIIDTTIYVKDSLYVVKDSLTFHTAATDTNGTVKKYLWSFDKVLWDSTNGPSIKTSLPASEKGKLILFIKVIDDDGIDSDIDSTIITVHLISANINAIVETTVAINDTILLYAPVINSQKTITRYVWTTDGYSYDTTTTGSYSMFWPLSTYGKKSDFLNALETEGVLEKNDVAFREIVLVYAVDSDGISSKASYIIVNIHLYRPTVRAINNPSSVKNGNRHIRDTIIPLKDSLFVGISATDTNGHIKNYYWDIGADGWDDSTNYPDSARFIKYPAGGNLSVVVGAKDDIGIMGTDTLHILFNRPPTSCGLKTDYDLDKGGWSDYNYSSDTGCVQVSFTGDDPDLPHDSLRYDLYWGTDQTNLVKKYSGLNSRVSISDVSISKLFYWKVVAKDLYGDSVIATGNYSLPLYPQRGTIFNLVTENAQFKHFSNYPFATYTYDNKMWLVTYRTRITDDNHYHYVYNSTDGVNWNLVTENAQFRHVSGYPFASYTYDNKIWLVTYRTCGDDDNHYHYVYNSTDGINWNLVTENAKFRHASNYPFAFYTYNKMWLVTYRTCGDDDNHYHYVYNSTDGVNWNLVTENAKFKHVSDYPFASYTDNTYDNKMWLVTYRTRITDDNHYHYVYNSTDGVNWNLVTENAEFKHVSNYPFAAYAYKNKVWLITYRAFNPDDNPYHYVYISR